MKFNRDDLAIQSRSSAVSKRDICVHKEWLMLGSGNFEGIDKGIIYLNEIYNDDDDYYDEDCPCCNPDHSHDED